MIWHGNVIDLATDSRRFFALPEPQRDELIAWTDERVGHHVRGVTRLQIHRFGRRLTISGIVKVETKRDVWCAVLDPLRPNDLARFTGDCPVRTARPSWWTSGRYRARHRAD